MVIARFDYTVYLLLEVCTTAAVPESKWH